MKTAANLQRLLDDVLAEDETSGAAREAAWQHTLRHVRRRRRARQAGRGALALAGAAAVALTLWLRPAPPASRPEIARVAPASGGVRIVTTTPLAPEMIVTTHAGTTPVVGTAAGAVAMVETNPARRIWEAIDDRQLFALLGNHPAVIVRHDNGDAELIFAHPEDAKGFPLP